MSTAIEAWGSAQGDATGDQPVHEDDITGGEPDAYGDEPVAVDHDAGLESTLDEEAALKKKKGMRTIMIGAGASAVLLVGMVGFAFMKGGTTVQPQEIAPGVQAATPAQSPAPGLAAPVSGAASGAEAMATERADGSPVPAPPVALAPDFGLQAVPGAAAAPVVPVAPVVASAPVAAAVATMTTAAFQPPAPTVSLEVPATLGAEPVKHGLSPAVGRGADKQDAQATAELERLRNDLATARAELGKRDESIQHMQGEMTKLIAKLEARPAAQPRVLRPQTVAAGKAAAKPVEAPAPQAEVAPAQVAAPVVAKGKVRSDFRIYAAVDGRVWVMGPDGEPTQIGARSPLSDGTRVTSIDTEKNVVYTTAGEIR